MALQKEAFVSSLQYPTPSKSREEVVQFCGQEGSHELGRRRRFRNRKEKSLSELEGVFNTDPGLIQTNLVNHEL
ncbi:MAG: hypothetical protein ABEI53_01810 [Candidatus Magasanikbacteria bacterium]